MSIDGCDCCGSRYQANMAQNDPSDPLKRYSGHLTGAAIGPGF